MMPSEGDSNGLREPQWFACHTRARHEKQVESALRHRGFESYLPTFSRVRQWKDRKKLVSWPLFPGYVFVTFDGAQLGRVLGTPGVATIVRTNGRPAPIRVEELENVRRFAAALEKVPAEPKIRSFVAVGTWVRVRTGPFTGVRGVVLERRNRRRVLVGVEAIGRGLEIDIEDEVLDPIQGTCGTGVAPSPG
jgi:transcription termination/antitermination protein NusG